LCILSFLVGAIGIGMLSSIPNSFMFLMCVGWTAVKPNRTPARKPALATGVQRITVLARAGARA